MGLFDKNTSKLPQQWIMLSATKQLHDIINASHERPQVIFKDSTSCGISAGVKQRLVGDWDNVADQADLYYLDLLSHRDISNNIADMSGVTHQSPQVIIYHNGEVVADTSHFAINVKFIEDVLDGL